MVDFKTIDVFANVLMWRRGWIRAESRRAERATRSLKTTRTDKTERSEGLAERVGFEPYQPL